MQKLLVRSGVKYECTQVTPSWAFSPTTFMHTCAPSAVCGSPRPCGKLRSTRSRGMEFSFSGLGSGLGDLVPVDVALPGRLLVARRIQSDVGEQMIRQGCELSRAGVRTRP